MVHIFERKVKDLAEFLDTNLHLTREECIVFVNSYINEYYDTLDEYLDDEYDLIESDTLG